VRQITSPAIILRRTNYGEADRIVTFLTPKGKLRALVKGVRRSKSKLAGGIELFSESNVSFIETKGDLARITSTRLIDYWNGIVGDLQRMMFGYEAMKLMDKIIEDDSEPEYYNLLKSVLTSLNDKLIELEPLEVWFYVRLLKLQGHGVNLKTDNNGKPLESDQLYSFSSDEMCFFGSNRGIYKPEDIKYLRLCVSKDSSVIKQIKGAGDIAKRLKPLIKTLTTQYS
jgi:DNA repair protein RecO (recombination protein O)